MDKQEFEQGYAERSGMTLHELREHGGHAEVCECGEDDCVGWKMVFPGHNESLQATMDAISHGRGTWAYELEQLEQSTLQGQFRRLEEAWLEFVLKAAYALGVVQVCCWLTRMIRRLTPGR